MALGGARRARVRRAHEVPRAGRAHGRGARRGPSPRDHAGPPARGTDPNWSFEAILEGEREQAASSTFFVLVHRDRRDGPAPETYARLRPRLVEVIAENGGEVGLHGGYLAAESPELLAEELRQLTELGAEVHGQRYHFLRLDPHANLAPLAGMGLRYDATLGFPEAHGFRAGIAHPFRPGTSPPTGRSTSWASRSRSWT